MHGDSFCTQDCLSVSLSHHVTRRALCVRPFNEAAAINNGAFNSDSPIVNLLSNVASNMAQGRWKTRTARYTLPNHQICSVARAMPSANAAMDVLAINYGLPSKPATNAFNKRISIDPGFIEGCSLASMRHVLQMAQQHMGFPDVEIDDLHDLLTAPANFPWAGVPSAPQPLSPSAPQPLSPSAPHTVVTVGISPYRRVYVCLVTESIGADPARRTWRNTR
jgi:hypothetical protein